MEALRRINKFHKTTVGYLVSGLVELVLAYAVGLWAIDNGSPWLYLGVLLLVIGVIQNGVKLGERAIAYAKASRA